MASNLATVTVFIDSDDPVYAARFREMMAENERYRRALEWYASASDYELQCSQIRARWALEGRDYDTPAPAAQSED